MTPKEYYESILGQIMYLRRDWGAEMLAKSLPAWDRSVTWLEGQGEEGAQYAETLREMFTGIRQEAMPAPPFGEKPELPVPGPAREPARAAGRATTPYGFEQRQRQIYSARDRYQPPKAAQSSTPQYPIRETRREGRPSFPGGMPSRYRGAMERLGYR